MNAGKSKKKSKKEHIGGRRSVPKRKLFVSLGILAGLAIVVVVLLAVKSGRETERRLPAPATTPNTQRLIGSWMKTDGGYIIAVRSVDPEGRVDAAYFNPRPINVFRAEASVEGNTAKLFLELQDEGYPGSTYTLEYDSTNIVGMGISYDSSPVSNHDRTADLPLDEQIRVAAAYAKNNPIGLSYSFSTSYVYFGEGKMDQTAQGERFKGEFDTNYLIFVAASVHYRF